MQKNSSINLQSTALFLGPALAILCYFLLRANQLDFDSSATAGVAICCVIWWIFEPIPIPITSLLPLASFPLLGILNASQVGAAYGSKLILLLLGGFILSTAMSHSGAHKRIALGMVNLFGGHNPKRVVFGFMTASAVLSMWISNTATTLMLLPVAVAVLQSTDNKSLAIPLFLGIAYSASLGGIGTPIGTPPNLIFMQVYEESTGKQIGFSEWMLIALPVIVLFLPIMAIWLTRGLASTGRLNIPKAGAWSQHEIRVLIVFAITATLWITRREPFGGWSGLFDLKYANDASVALIAVIFMFIIPNGKGDKLLNWKTAENIPWGVLLLFGGGICLAKAFVESGLSNILGETLSAVASLGTLITIALIALVVTFMTEATSNTATTTLLMPVLAAAALGINIDPMILMVPAAMSASCAFMLPVATAPNSIVFGSGYISTQKMAREGFVLNIIGAFIITTVCYLNFQ